MRSIRLLFEETKHDELTSDELKHFSRANKYIKDISVLPPFHCPEIGSNQHKKDLDAVKHYYHNQSLDKDFLKTAHKSCKKIFKKFCKENNLEVNWKLIKEILGDVEDITFKLKRKFARPRPKEILIDEDSEYKEIYDMGSSSFPSGHTTTAYFIANLLSHFYPKDASHFNMMAELIGQSRIENAVHYPSDVLYGKLLGEMLANIFLNNHANSLSFDIMKSKLSRKDEKNLSNYFKNKALKNYGKEDSSIEKFGKLLGEFLYNSNRIEGKRINYDDCMSAGVDFVRGYPIKTRDKVLSSSLKMLCMAHKLKDIDSPYTSIATHKCINKNLLNKGKPGMLRYEPGHSKYGNAYSDPDKIFNHMLKLSNVDNPFVRHIIFELIHPFCDGNGRTGRIILLSDLDYDFEKINKFCDKNYFKRIESAIDKYGNIDNLLE